MMQLVFFIFTIALGYLVYFLLFIDDGFYSKIAGILLGTGELLCIFAIVGATYSMIEEDFKIHKSQKPINVLLNIKNFTGKCFYTIFLCTLFFISYYYISTYLADREKESSEKKELEEWRAVREMNLKECIEKERNSLKLDTVEVYVEDTKKDDLNGKGTIPKESVSKWYQVGYRKGYDNGIDDAEMRNEYDRDYSEHIKLSGKAKEDFLDGYKSGYDDGYDDGESNNDDEE